MEEIFEEFYKMIAGCRNKIRMRFRILVWVLVEKLEFIAEFYLVATNNVYL